MIPQLEIILIASIVAISCSLVGVFLVMRKMSMMSDAISHSILLGIVLAFFLTKNINSPLLIVGAALVGLLTVTLTEMLITTRKMKEDASIGLIFPALFSIGVILITKFASNVHIDIDAVLLGELAFAPFNRFMMGGIDLGAKALWVMGCILVLNLIFILLFYKELKLSTFDSALAAALGFSPVLMHYSLMGLVSITAVGAFDAVGSILVVALMIAPPSAAYLLSHKLSNIFFISILISILSASLGYLLAFIFNGSIAGGMAIMTGIFFLFSLFFSPTRGLFAKAFSHYRKKQTFASELLLVHLLDHEGKPEEKTENTIKNTTTHMNWSEKFSGQIIKKSLEKQWITREKNKLYLTSQGREMAKIVMVRV